MTPPNNALHPTARAKTSAVAWCIDSVRAAGERERWPDRMRSPTRKRLSDPRRRRTNSRADRRSSPAATSDSARQPHPARGSSTRARVFYLRYEVRPQPRRHLRHGGAFVNCWVWAGAVTIAARYARKVIRSEGWLLHRREEARAVARREFLNLPKALASYDRAKVDGYSFTFHLWLRSRRAG